MFKKQMTIYRPNWIPTRIESWASQGIPDVLICLDSGRLIMLELKIAKKTAVEISPHQAAFAASHSHAPVACLIYRQPAGGTNGLLAYRGEGVANIRVEGLSEPPEGQWHEPIEWESVFTYLETM